MAAGFGFLVKGLGLGGGAALLGELEDFDLEFAGFVFDVELVTGADFAGGFGGVGIGRDAAEVTGVGGEGAGFEEAGGPEPFVDAHFGCFYFRMDRTACMRAY